MPEAHFLACHPTAHTGPVLLIQDVRCLFSETTNDERPTTNVLDLPREDAKRLPRYPTVLAVRVGRLAVDQRFSEGAASGKRCWPTPPHEP